MGNYIRASHIPQGEGSLYSKIWSAAALADAEYHDIIIKTHMEYIKSGSNVITTNSYAIQPNYYFKAFGEKEYEELMEKHAKLSVNLALTAKRRISSEIDVKIFGSLGPICESHQPRMFVQYKADKGSSFCIDFYEKLSWSLYKGGVDGFLIETMNSWDEAYLALEGVKRTIQKIDKNRKMLPIIVSLQGSLRNNDLQPIPEELGPFTIRQFLKYFDRNRAMNITALGLNCAGPEDMVASFQCMFGDNQKSQDDSTSFSDETIVAAFKKRNINICAYPNLNDVHKLHKNGYNVSNGKNVEKRQDLVEEDYKGFCNLMQELVRRFDISYIGGCCGCPPNAIRKLREIYAQQ
jgi:S-methylmethionine-dependent homocysteine/selenocysteine methylase